MWTRTKSTYNIRAGMRIAILLYNSNIQTHLSNYKVQSCNVICNSVPTNVTTNICNCPRKDVAMSPKHQL